LFYGACLVFLHTKVTIIIQNQIVMVGAMVFL